MVRWPTFFIIGALRAGTTSLYEYLKKVPSIYMSPVKEPNYFSESIKDEELFTKPIREKTKYLDLFRKVKDEVAIGEATPYYLWDPKSPKLIRSVVPNAKIIIILRDPVMRAYSHYLMLVATKGETATFKEAIERSLKFSRDDFSGRIINAGFYAEQVKRYFEAFDSKQIKIIIFEEFIKEPKLKVKEILNFLQVRDEPPDNVGKVYNPATISRSNLLTKIMKNKIIKKVGKRLLPLDVGEVMVKGILSKKGTKPQMLDRDRKILQKIYVEDVKYLEKYLHRKLPWKFSNGVE